MAKISQVRKKLSDYVIDEIKRMLVSGEIKEGAKLPNQNEFAKNLGVSRLPLREAMYKLRLLGVIEEKPGAGTRIIKGVPAIWEDRLEAPFLSDHQAALEFLEARRLMESAMISFSIDHIDKDDIANLRKDIQTMRTALKNGDIESYLSADLAFHSHMASATHNRYLGHMLATIQNLLRQFMMEAFQEIPKLISDSMQHHEKILKYITEHKLKAAVDSINGHLDSIIRLLKEYYVVHKRFLVKA
jgi:GntR family transcriptional repressor for pyruvate dehydrogenase complex